MHTPRLLEEEKEGDGKEDLEEEEEINSPWNLGLLLCFLCLVPPRSPPAGKPSPATLVLFTPLTRSATLCLFKLLSIFF